MEAVAEFDELMTEVMAGSEEAIRYVADTYTPYIIRVIRTSLPQAFRSKLDSVDFAQSLWASLLINKADFTRLKSPRDLMAYLAQAARNEVVDKTRHFRSQKNDVAREQTLSEQASALKKARCSSRVRGPLARDPSPSVRADLRERWENILVQTTDRDKKILELRLEGCSFAEISKELQITEATARRAMRNLMAKISE
jgi:RNA polymerase sigma factor (sigma-70 family)